MPGTDFYPVEVEQESVRRGLKTLITYREDTKESRIRKIGALPDPGANDLARDIDRLLKGKMQFGTDGEKALAQSLHSSLINYLKRK